ncbi:MAG: UDP-N-acetylglucosamine--N-acetylmuramyl-(pentapeptide) pyrophosphoryl-undecaprenol N-acetylglucosamine transferase [Phycisphaera sp.]|nr:UDP-N-acetylglucosamine--N-acetylmuramyl-(pentapeptide) pyrophosphoryl-undecaprenol N-acetylglucosamine transferase [Phycisphaera sp.]
MPVPERIVFAGGGTGGTVGPGIAIAERLAEMASSIEVVFLCSDRPVDRRLLEPGGWDHRPTPARSPGVRPGTAIRFLHGWHATRRIARTVLDPAAGCRVVALGGFVAPPVVREAVRRGVPVDLLNLDAVAGRANRWIARRATRRFTAVPSDLPDAGDAIGVPLRRAVLAEGPASRHREALGLRPDLLTLLVTGASQGAASIDRMMSDLAIRREDWFAGWQILHLAGSDRVEHLVRTYSESGIPAVVRPFLERMGDAWGAADLAITRGGASSIAEVAASRTPAIVIPYPWHEDQHQAKNAEGLARIGAVLVHTDPTRNPAATPPLESSLRTLLQSNEERARMFSAFGPMPEDAASGFARTLIEG